MLRRTRLDEAPRDSGRARRPPGGGRHLGLTLALVLALSAFLAACGSGQEHSERAPEEQAGGERASIPRPLLSNFSLLRAPADGIPADVRRTLQVPVPGMRWSLARLMPVVLPGRYWLVPGARDLCLVATTPESPAVGTVCASIGQALQHGVANTSLNRGSGERIVVGAVPDGTRAVVIRSGDSTASATVHRGSFVQRDTLLVPPSQVSLR